MVKINGTKNALFIFLWAPTHHGFTFNLQFLYELKAHHSKSVCRIFHFWFNFVFIKVQQNAWILWIWNAMIPFKIKVIEKSYSFACRPLVFKLEQEVLKFNDICVSWSFPKTDQVTNLLNLENQSFEVSFFK